MMMMMMMWLAIIRRTLPMMIDAVAVAAAAINVANEGNGTAKGGMIWLEERCRRRCNNGFIVILKERAGGTAVHRVQILGVHGCCCSTFDFMK